MKSAAKAYHDEKEATFTKVIEHHWKRDFDLQPSVVNRLRERLSKRCKNLVKLQMTAELAELEWEVERRQEKVRRHKEMEETLKELVAAYDTIAELRRENAELSTKYHETHRVYAEMSENREKIESNNARLDTLRAEIAADEARERVLWLRGFI